MASCSGYGDSASLFYHLYPWVLTFIHLEAAGSNLSIRSSPYNDPSTSTCICETERYSRFAAVFPRLPLIISATSAVPIGQSLKGQTKSENSILGPSIERQKSEVFASVQVCTWCVPWIVGSGHKCQLPSPNKLGSDQHCPESRDITPPRRACGRSATL